MPIKFPTNIRVAISKRNITKVSLKIYDVGQHEIFLRKPFLFLEGQHSIVIVILVVNILDLRSFTRGLNLDSEETD